MLGYRWRFCAVRVGRATQSRLFAAFVAVAVLPVSALAQTYGPPLVGQVVPVNTGPGDQTDPHVSGGLVAYTSEEAGFSQIRYHDLLSGSDESISNQGFDFLSDVSGSLIVFTNQHQNQASGVLRGAVVPFTIESLVARFGARDPAHPAAPSSFRVGTIVLSIGRLLSADEMAYFDHMAARGEATTPVPFTSGLARGTTKPFYVATKQRGRLVTAVR